MLSNNKKSAYNILFGIGSQVILAIASMIIPRLFITTYGSEMNGFLSSINQALAYVVLLEAGIGNSTLQALYEPLGRNDKNQINAVMSASAKFYTRTGWLYLLAIIILSIIYPLVVVSSIPFWQQTLIILIVGGSGAIGYFVHAKLRMLLQADGRHFAYTAAYTIVQLAINICKVIFIMIGVNVVIIQLAHLALNVLLAMFMLVYAKRQYPWLNCKYKPEFNAIAQRKSVMVHEFAWLVFNHTDVLLLTLFTDLKVVSVYVLYNMIVDMVSSAIQNINSAFTFRLGQSFAVNFEKFRDTYAKYELSYIALSMAIYSVTYVFLTPFIQIYTEGITDIIYVDKWLPILFVAIKILVSGRAVASNTITIAGHFKQTQWRSVLETGINFVVSLICVRFMGIYGVLIGTIAALFYRANDILFYTNRKILKQSPLGSYSKWAINLALFLLVAFISRYVSIYTNSYFSLAWSAIYFAATAVAIFALGNAVFFPREVKCIVKDIKKLILKR